MMNIRDADYFGSRKEQEEVTATDELFDAGNHLGPSLGLGGG